MLSFSALTNSVKKEGYTLEMKEQKCTIIDSHNTHTHTKESHKTDRYQRTNCLIARKGRMIILNHLQGLLLP